MGGRSSSTILQPQPTNRRNHMKYILRAIVLILFLFPTLALADTDQGMTSETHKKNVGKILWAAERIKKDMQDRITYKNKFNFGEPLYGRVFLPKSLPRLSKDNDPSQCLNSNGEFQLKLYIDGKDSGILNEYNWNPTWTTAQINLALTPGDGVDDGNMGVPEKWAKIINDLPQGTHQIKVEFLGGRSGKCEKRKYAEGGFALAKGEGAAPIDPNKQALPAPAMQNPKLEASMIEAVKSRGWKNETPVKVVILEPDWRIIRDAFNNITDREINTFVVLKNTSTGKCRANDISFRQPYKGGGKYGRTEVYGIGLKSFNVDCQ